MQLSSSLKFWAVLAVLSGVAAAFFFGIYIRITMTIWVDCLGEGCIERIFASVMAKYWYLKVFSVVFAAISFGSLGMTIMLIIRRSKKRRVK